MGPGVPLGVNGTDTLPSFNLKLFGDNAIEEQCWSSCFATCNWSMEMCRHACVRGSFGVD